MKFSPVATAVIGVVIGISSNCSNNYDVTAFAPTTTKAAARKAASRSTSTTAASTTTTSLSANYPNIWSTMGSLEGPSVCWGPEGVILGQEEIAIKEYDNFNMFRAALEQCGLANELRGGLGPYTLLLPTDTAVCAFDGILDEETLRYHIIKGDVYSDELDGKFETLNPDHSVTAKQEFRKGYVDDALVGHVGQTYGTPYPINVICENGIIHSIPTVLKPGFDPAGAEVQLTTRRPDMDYKAGQLSNFKPIQ